MNEIVAPVKVVMGVPVEWHIPAGLEEDERAELVSDSKRVHAFLFDSNSTKRTTGEMVAMTTIRDPDVSLARGQRIADCVNAMASVRDPLRFMGDVEELLRYLIGGEWPEELIFRLHNQKGGLK